MTSLFCFGVYLPKEELDDLASKAFAWAGIVGVILVLFVGMFRRVRCDRSDDTPHGEIGAHLVRGAPSHEYADFRSDLVVFPTFN